MPFLVFGHQAPSLINRNAKAGNRRFGWHFLLSILSGGGCIVSVDPARLRGRGGFEE